MKNIVWMFALLLTAGVTTASANDVNCDDAPFFGVISGTVNDKVIVDSGPCTIAAAGAVNADIEAEGFGVTVLGTVNGNIKQEGRGGVSVGFGSNVNGNIEEKGRGGVFIDVAPGCVFNGGVKEEGRGRVRARVRGHFDGNIEEKGAGPLRTQGPGSFNGNTKEEDAGACSNTIAAFNGNACE